MKSAQLLATAFLILCFIRPASAQPDLLLAYRLEQQGLTAGPDEPQVVIPPGRKEALQAAGLSLLLPGAGQARNGQLLKAGTMAVVEAAGIVWYLNRQRQAQRLEDRYHALGDNGFSVVKYAAWLVEYNRIFETSTVQLQDLAMPGQTIDPNSLSANARDDWHKVDIQKLRALENSTLFAGSTGTAFSHTMPDYGSQQYYELMSKYYQFGPGWKDYARAPGPSLWNPAEMSPDWFRHGRLGRRFNDAYRTADLAVNILVVNHLAAALDAFIVRSRRAHVTAALSPETGALTAGFRYDL